MATMGFMTKWDKSMGDQEGKPTYFVQKIWESFNFRSDVYLLPFVKEAKNRFSIIDKPGRLYPKKHSIRNGIRKWKPGDKIHMVINNRTKDRFQFAPVLKVKCVQDIIIEEMIMIDSDKCWVIKEETRFGIMERIMSIKVDGSRLNSNQICQLSMSDGFDHPDHFFRYFNCSRFEGQLIHWTSVSY